jgi:hypothetical protein
MAAPRSRTGYVLVRRQADADDVAADATWGRYWLYGQPTTLTFYGPIGTEVGACVRSRTVRGGAAHKGAGGPGTRPSARVPCPPSMSARASLRER